MFPLLLAVEHSLRYYPEKQALERALGGSCWVSKQPGNLALLFMDGKVQAGGTEEKLVVLTWVLTYYGTGTRASCGSDVSYVSKAGKFII